MHKSLCMCNVIWVHLMCTFVTMHAICEGLPPTMGNPEYWAESPNFMVPVPVTSLE